MYLVDLEHAHSEQVLDWNSGDINWEGRGADRGLRGIAFHDDSIYVAASDELFVLNRQFRITASFRNSYLKHCHEIWKFGHHLYVTSTGFDSVLRFDLNARRFDSGIFVFPQGSALGARVFDPDQPGGPTAGIGFHFNNVHVDQRGIFISGRKLTALVRLNATGIAPVAQLPLGTHNARPFRDGVLFNNTESDSVTFISPAARVSIPVPRYPEGELKNANLDESNLARQAFGRGLCPISDTLIAGGSSPTTVAIYDLTSSKVTHALNITMDVRNAAHGLAVWPY
ncbi:MAG: hypothetical protein ABL973_06785 [Micropepsaceae bacterium]